MPSRAIALLDLSARDDTFLGDGALRGLQALLERRGHGVTVWHSVLSTDPGGADAWRAAITHRIAEAAYDVVVLPRAWEPALIDAVRRGMRPGARLVRLTAGVTAALDGSFDHVLDEAGLLALLDGDPAPATATFQPTTARELRAARALTVAPAQVVIGEVAGARPAITGPGKGCPFLLDATRNPVFAGLPLDRAVVQTRGCTFCLDNTGGYATPTEAEVLESWLGQLAAIQAGRSSGGRCEVLLTDERPHPWLPAFFAALTSPVELLVKSRVDWLVEFADTALAEACRRAEATGSVLHVYLVGFESFDQGDLDLFNKGVSVVDNLRAIETLRSLAAQFPRTFEYRRYRAHGVVLFTPWTTPASLLENARVMREVRFEELRSEAVRTRLRLYPRTPLHALAAAHGLLHDRHDVGRGDRAAEQGYDASAPWRFRDARVEAIFRAATTVAAHDRTLADADVLELATRYVLRTPEVVDDPDAAGPVLLQALASWPLRPATTIARLGPIVAGFDREIEAVRAGDKRACLKENVPRALADALVRGYRGLGLAAAIVEHHGLDATGGTHRAGDDFAIVAVADSEPTLAEVLRLQRAHAEGRAAPLEEMGALMGYPPCCVIAFAAQDDRRDNVANERLTFRRAPYEPLAPQLGRLGAITLVSHHPCSPACAASVTQAEATLARIGSLDRHAAVAIRAELARPVLFLNHGWAATLHGRWAAGSDRFEVDELAPLAGQPLPTDVAAISLSARGVTLHRPHGQQGELSAAGPILIVPGAPLAPPALAAIGGPLPRPLRWLELTPDYRCNNQCLGCFAVAGQSAPAAMAVTMSSREAAATLARGRKDGLRALWLGGGEPTLRKDLFALVREARRLGYERVKLQTNGMLMSYPEFTERCVEAGVTEVSFAIKGADATTHDRLTQTPGCHALLVKAIAEVARHGLPMEGDILVYASNAAQLPAMIGAYHRLGLARFQLWLLSLADAGTRVDLAAEVPRIADVMPHIVAAMDLGLSARPDFITSLHTPACTVPASHHRALFHAAELGLLVANPGGHQFRLEESPMEGGAWLDGCARCRLRARCGGPRADYLAIHGDREFTPVV